MKRLPFLLGLAFVAVTSTRVADFAGGDKLAWFYSIGLTGSVFITAYFLDFKTTFRRSTLILGVLILFDTAFNLGETLKWSVESGRWNFVLEFSNGIRIYLYQIADIIYGIFPTIAAVLMAYLAKSVERIPVTHRRGTLKDKVSSALADWLTGRLPETENGKLPEKIEQEFPLSGNHPVKVCSKCDQEKPITEFYSRKDTTDGTRSECKECTKAKRNPRLEQVRTANYRAKTYYDKSAYKLTLEEWEEIIKTHAPDGNCPACKEEKPLTLDHVIPLNLNGSNTPDNIQPLCFDCHMHKGNGGTTDYRVNNYARNGHHASPKTTM